MKMFCSKTGSRLKKLYHLSPKWEIHDSGHGLNGFSIQPTTIHWFEYEGLYKLLPRYTVTRHMLLNIHILMHMLLSMLCLCCLLEIKDSWFLIPKCNDGAIAYLLRNDNHNSQLRHELLHDLRWFLKILHPWSWADPGISHHFNPSDTLGAP